MSTQKTCSSQRSQNGVTTWTAEDIDILITSVRNYEEIYDQANPNYSNREVVDQIWHRISTKLNKTGKECSKKWQLLRAGYRKRRHSWDAPSGSGAKKPRKWAFYDALTFLEVHMVERPTITNVIQPESSSSRSYVTDSEGFPEVPLSDGDTESRADPLIIWSQEVGNHYEFSDDGEEEELAGSGVPSSTPPTSTSRKQAPTPKGKKMDDVDIEFSKYLKAASARKEFHKEKKGGMELFLLSCVEEANALSLPAQRTFKRRILESLSELSNDP